jgi:hypothetical protein
MIGPLAAMAIDEVHALHAFFVGWFRAGGPHPDFAELEKALAPDFRMVAPDGAARDRTGVVAGIRAAMGMRPADFAIVILEPRPVFEAGQEVLLEFIEQQYRGGETTRRQSSALFTAEKGAPRGVVWRHLHETWMHKA